MKHHALAAASLLAFCCAPAWAQSAASGTLQQIVVTAERRIENIRDVPSSVSALSGELLDTLNSSGQDVRQLAARVPSLNIESSFGRAFPRFYIRGLGNTDFDLNASQPVSLVFDDVVQENPILKGFPIFDLERIEVLRGPQGTLFGRNSPAGVIKFESAKPTSRLEGYGQIGIGRYSSINVEGAINVPLAQGTALRVSLQSQNRDDWVTNTYAAGPTKDLEGYHDNAARVQFGFGSGAAFNGLVNVHGRDLKGSARLFRANIISPKTNDLVPGFDPAKVSYDGVNDQDLTSTGGSVKMRWQLPGMALTSITGYEHVKVFSRGDIDGGFGASFLPPGSYGPGVIPFASETADGIPKHSQWTQELRLESDTKGPLDWQAGVFFFKEDYKIESFSYDSLAGNAQDGYERVRQKNTASAVFGALSYTVNPQLKLRAGARYTIDKKTFGVEDYFANGFAPCIGPTIGAIPGPPRCTLADIAALGPLSASPKDKKFNWDVSGTYTLDKDINLYARAATGFRGSSVQGSGAFNDQSVAGPETVTSVEAGVKADLLNRRARVNFGVFSYRVKDLQLTAVGGAANANILLNAEKATGSGFELDMQALLTERLVASLGVGYNRTKIKDPGLAVSPCGNGIAPPALNCTVTDPLDANGKALIDGNPLPQAPKTTVNFTLRYSQPTAGGEWYALTDWVYRSKINFFLYESREFTGKALTEGGVRVGYVWGNGKYEAALFGRNITDQIRIVGGIDFNNLTGFINEPRTWGVQFRAQF